MIGSETNFYLNLHFLEYFDDEVSICPPSLPLPSNSKIVDTDRLHCSTFLTFLLWKLCLCSGFDAELVNLIWRWNKDDTINLVFWKLIPWPKSQTLINVSGKIFKSLPSFQEDDVQQQDILFWKILFRKTKDFPQSWVILQNNAILRHTSGFNDRSWSRTRSYFPGDHCSISEPCHQSEIQNLALIYFHWLQSDQSQTDKTWMTQTKQPIKTTRAESQPIVTWDNLQDRKEELTESGSWREDEDNGWEREVSPGQEPGQPMAHFLRHPEQTWALVTD